MHVGRAFVPPEPSIYRLYRGREGSCPLDIVAVFGFEVLVRFFAANSISKILPHQGEGISHIYPFPSVPVRQLRAWMDN